MYRRFTGILECAHAAVNGLMFFSSQLRTLHAWAAPADYILPHRIWQGSDTSWIYTSPPHLPRQWYSSETETDHGLDQSSFFGGRALSLYVSPLFFHFSQFDGNIEHLKIGDPVEFEMTYDRRTGKPIASAVSKIAPEVVMSEERVIGTVTKADKPYLAEIAKKLKEAGVLDAVSFHRNVSREEKQRLLSTLSVLSVPADYGEAFGLYVLESLAAGVPVVQPNHAAFPELLSATGGGRLCEHRNPEDLARVLGDLLVDPEALVALGNTGRKAVEAQFTAQAMATRVEAVYAKFAN